MAFVGCVISVSIKNYSVTYASVGGTHCQGVVVHVDPGNQAITLSQPFVDGIPGKDHSITLSASDIADLKILKTAEETRSYVPLSAGSPLVENGNAPTEPVRKESFTQSKQVQIIRKDSQSHDPVEAKRLQCGLEVLGYRKAPIHEPASQSPYVTADAEEDHGFSRQSKSKGSHYQRAGHAINAGSISDSELQQNSSHNSRPARNGRGRVNTPKKTDYYKGGQRRREDEICFGLDVDAIIGEEFDFERSNQMFDKEAVMEEITAEQRGYALNKSTGQDSSRQHSSAQLQRHEVPEAKYRHDEMILGTPSPATYRQIKVKSGGEEEISRTDSGLIVPCINRKLQVKILTLAAKHGFSEERQVEAAGRSACEMLLQLVGGSQRLSPQNSHQTPSVVVLCGGGSYDQGSPSLILDSPSTIGLAIARNLANHRVGVVVCVPQRLIDSHLKNPLFATEMKLLKMTDAKLVLSINDLPPTPTDVIVSALDYETGKTPDDWVKDVTLWANQNKAPILAVDPTGMATSHPICEPLQAKWSLQFVLPLTSTKKIVDVSSASNPISSSQLYLCDLAIPRKVFREAGIQYQSPFGAKSFIALHRD